MVVKLSHSSLPELHLDSLTQSLPELHLDSLTQREVRAFRMCAACVHACVTQNGWVFLGDLERYVSASSKRFLSVRLLDAAPGHNSSLPPSNASVLVLEVVGAPGERLSVTALRPLSERDESGGDWEVITKEVGFVATCSTKRVAGQPESACTMSIEFQ
eukprot:SAG11_NODE_7155_length_1185_cov_2.779006_2_plen_159_part_00